MVVLDDVFHTDDTTAIAADAFFQQLWHNCSMRKEEHSFAAAAVHAHARLIGSEAEHASFHFVAAAATRAMLGTEQHSGAMLVLQYNMLLHTLAAM